MNPIAIVSSIIIAIGCFMPWIQLGALFANRGIDNPDGAIMLISSVISGAVAIYNQSKNCTKNSWIYLVVGIIGLATAYLDLNEVRGRAEDIAKGISGLSNMFDRHNEVSIMNFVGSGLYIVAAGSFGLLLCGLGVFKSNTNTEPEVAIESAEVFAPKYVKTVAVKKTGEQIENEKYKHELITLNQSIKTQHGKLIGGGMTDQILEHIDNLCTTQDEAIHLLNTYQDLFHTDLIEDLKKLNSSYEAIERNLSTFIELDIIEENYPHNPKE
jgi:hypothetical protein